MEDYMADFEELWEKFEGKVGENFKIIPRKVGSSGKLDMMYMGGGDYFVVILGMNDTPVEYAKKADKGINRHFKELGMKEMDIGKTTEAIMKIAAFGRESLDYKQYFIHGGKIESKFKMYNNEVAKDVNQMFSISHAKPIFRGKGKLSITAASTKEKVKEYLSKALEILQEENR
ncbi:MAG: hypothetical protein HZB68_03310 [Candidatus Aenigmarchaeota archaeon]|nr:hypothetical protein [Candidatus Aenigmarchaeota archaeon]